MDTILVTVGTSLLTNMQRAKLDVNAQPVRLQFIREQGDQRASAETNSLRLLLKDKEPKSTEILFFHSETEEGEKCAQTLTKYYENQGYTVDSCKIEGLQYQQKAFKLSGLRNLVRELALTTRQKLREGRSVHINATGGFKAEIAYATLVGLLFDVPVYYLHEQFQDLIQMPPAPIAWDYSLLDKYDLILQQLEACKTVTDEELRQLTQRYNVDCDTDPDWRKIELILERERTDSQELVALSPAGEAYYEAYQALLERKGDPIFLTPALEKQLAGLEPTKRQEIEELLAKMAHRELRQGNAEKMRNSGLYVYPKGPRNARIIFLPEEQGSGVKVCEIAWHNDGSYDALCDRKPQPEDYQNVQWIAWWKGA